MEITLEEQEGFLERHTSALLKGYNTLFLEEGRAGVREKCPNAAQQYAMLCAIRHTIRQRRQLDEFYARLKNFNISISFHIKKP